MTDKKPNYKWVILLLFMLATIMTQLNWLSFAPIASEIENHYQVSADLVLLLTASYMIIYIPVNFPASWLIDKYGLKWGTGVGVILTGVFSMLRFVFADNFTLLMTAQLMTAVGQPFLLNSFTKLATNWFDEEDFALATGIGTMSVLLGDMIGMFLTPYLFVNIGYEYMLLVYGLLSLIAMVLYLLFVKSQPEGVTSEKVFNYAGVKQLFKNRQFNMLLVLIFAGLGAFNAISSEVDSIFSRFNDVGAGGTVGGVLLAGGIVGAVILSTISDMKHRRVIFLKMAMLVSIPSTLGLLFINNFSLLLVVAFFFGFFLVSALPVGLIYAVEITTPITEETSNGVMMTLGQVAGILLLISFNMYVITILFAIAFAISLMLKDP
ncbi:MAG: MFS transporter [Candidatus Heimdallarchaeota archaeon]|nr:MFS transporter [Candidatus Heimdallarchaeota archaeon]